MGARALFKDRMFGTRHFWRWQGTPTEELAKQLHETFATAQLGPGAHYRLIEQFAEVAGFKGMFIFDPRPAFEIEAEFRRNQATEATANDIEIG